MMNRTAITMPESLLKEVTLRARRAGISRSRFIAEAVQAHLERSTDRAILERLNRVYAQDNPSDAKVRKAFQRQAARAAKGTW
jgi:metal-responsive CopG/Arc/MetJ family transcriptional regulator